MLNSLRLRTRIGLLVAAALVGLIITNLFAAMAVKRDLLEGRQLQLVSVMHAAKRVVVQFHDQAAKGMITEDEAKERAAAMLAGLRYGGADGMAEYFFIWDMEGRSVMHPFRPEWKGQSKLDLLDGDGRPLVRRTLEAAAGSGFVDVSFPRPGGTVPVPKLLHASSYAPWGWVIGTGAYIDDVDAQVGSRLLTDLSFGALVIAIMIVIAVLVGRSILKQIGGEPAEALGLMERAAGGDLTVELRGAPKGSLLDGLGRMLQSIRDMVSQISGGAAQLKGNADNIVHASQQVAEAAHRQADATSSMAAAIEQMTVSINHISDSARDTESNSSSAAALAEGGEAKVTHATEEMQRIAGSVAEAAQKIRTLESRAGEISSIANVIKEIAAQTNLLALNAAIEAARAGEQGRGFAVVADEVRGLAERTAAATVQIEQMIGAIQSETATAVAAMDHTLPQVARGVDLAQEAAQSLREIRGGAGMTLSRIRDVALATREQSTASNAIAQQVESIAQMVEETSASMQQTASSARELERIAEALHAMVGRFRH
ncbi:methyl-accepting chemotaxis protein [Azoarcus olearius]|uniref:Methyl-accepting chemotaxis protein n=1 Tax=Azoarcus sp. (strain BH72) TaxID=418699 RepID=A1K2V7_AZOSB|nr:methyl-accepting chemotaxis protein [Azoarcus olearius]ANQ83631.1 putative methyl-accepting chemotaxis protein [Azoarcus olearius]CAL93162.1 putative methyl-accepting chemotaxis protein [Azoarcus olearius]